MPFYKQLRDKDQILENMVKQTILSHKISSNLRKEKQLYERSRPRRKFNADPLPRKLNRRLAAGMGKQLLKKVETRLAKDKKFRNSCPYLILKLHHQLIVKQKRKDTNEFKEMTEKAKVFLLRQKKAFKDQYNYMRVMRNCVFFRKLMAFLRLRNYLIQQRIPTEEKLYSIIRSGIYGTIKGKCNSKWADIHKYVQDYERMRLEKKEEDGRMRIEEDGRMKIEEDGRMRIEEDGRMRIEEDGRMRMEEDGMMRIGEDAMMRVEEDEKMYEGQLKSENLWEISQEGMGYQSDFWQSPKPGDIHNPLRFACLEQSSLRMNFQNTI